MTVLAAYACDPSASRGRRIAEADSPTRNAFQRDRDRIVHSSAFRRLVYKTQVFLNHEGDLFRTRMTHTLEVAQVARSIARALGLHEDLVEAIALAHDVGHTPFGHAGQDALDRCLKDDAPDGEGFEHNFQSLRIVDALEQRYPAFDGLNLCFETREGILKHCSRANALRLEAAQPGGVGRRFLDRMQPSLEAQLCNLADSIAYNAHDVDDGLRSGLLALDALRELPVFDRHCESALREHSGLAGRRLALEAVRRMLSAQILDVIEATRERLQRHAPASADEARALPALVAFSDDEARDSRTLQRFLHGRLYRHPRVVETNGRAQRAIAELYAAYRGQAASDPDRPAAAPLATPRAVADYVAGMTDRYALQEHHRLTGSRLFADALA